jgi:hypothetical protein
MHFASKHQTVRDLANDASCTQILEASFRQDSKFFAFCKVLNLCEGEANALASVPCNRCTVALRIWAIKSAGTIDQLARLMYKAGFDVTAEKLGLKEPRGNLNAHGCPCDDDD